MSLTQPATETERQTETETYNAEDAVARYKIPQVFSVKIGRLSTTTTYFCREQRALATLGRNFLNKYEVEKESKDTDAASDAEKYFIDFGE